MSAYDLTIKDFLGTFSLFYTRIKHVRDAKRCKTFTYDNQFNCEIFIECRIWTRYAPEMT